MSWRGDDPAKLARRLPAILRAIQAGKYPGLEGRIERGYCNTDRKIAGTRLRRPGKGRWGNRLIVWVKGHPDWKVIDHNAAETYRRNSEVEDWLRSYMDGRGKARVGYSGTYTRKQIQGGEPWKS